MEDYEPFTTPELMEAARDEISEALASSMDGAHRVAAIERNTAAIYRLAAVIQDHLERGRNDNELDESE
jgi:hypothetical protein